MEEGKGGGVEGTFSVARMVEVEVASGSVVVGKASGGEQEVADEERDQDPRTRLPWRRRGREGEVMRGPNVAGGRAPAGHHRRNLGL